MWGFCVSTLRIVSGVGRFLDFNGAYIFLRIVIEAIAEISEQLLLANEMLPAYLVIGRSGNFYMVPIVGILC